MTRAERLLLLAGFGATLALLAVTRPQAAALGTAVGVAAGVLLSGRLRRMRGRMDERLGDVPPEPTGFRLGRPLSRAVVQLAVLSGLFVTTVFVPFLGPTLFIGSAAAATALPTVLTAARLRR